MENKNTWSLFTTVLPASSRQPGGRGNRDLCGDKETQKSIYENKGDLSSVAAMSFTAENVPVGLPMNVDLRLDCYKDNTCMLILELPQFGVELDADQGTYHISEAMKFRFHFENAGEVTGEPDYASATEGSIDVVAAYKAELEEQFNGSMVVLSIDARLTGTYGTGGTATAG